MGKSEKEIWSTIVGFGGKYEVSNRGSIRKNDNGIIKHVKQYYDKGYKTVVLQDGGERKNCKVHRLVATTFIPNDKGLPCVNHKDENKENNMVENLEWCTHYRNNHYGTRTERVNRTLSRPVIATVVGMSDEEYYPSIRIAGIMLNYSEGNLSQAANGKRKSCKGRTWRFANEGGEQE